MDEGNWKDLLRIKKETEVFNKELSPNAYGHGHYFQAPCPTCGHCPTCGRGGYPMSPWTTTPQWTLYSTTTSGTDIT